MNLYAALEFMPLPCNNFQQLYDLYAALEIMPTPSNVVRPTCNVPTPSLLYDSCMSLPHVRLALGNMPTLLVELCCMDGLPREVHLLGKCARKCCMGNAPKMLHANFLSSSSPQLSLSLSPVTIMSRFHFF
jgi:hypothetical protein